MRHHQCLGRVASIAVMCLVTFSELAGAQANGSSPRMIAVEGVQTRVWTAGLEERNPRQPVIVLEAGGGADLDTWKPVFAELARLGPLVAYDRRGHGESGADTERPTLQHVAQTLHTVLREVGASPPYVLVGHSWGGLIIRGFSAMYSAETAGLVYLDVPDFETTRQERASALPPQDRKRALSGADLPAIPPDTPPGRRAVYEEMLDELRKDYPTARGFRQPAGIPVAVVIASRADKLKGNGGAMVRLQIAKQSEWVLGSNNGLFVLAGHTGHAVHRDDSALVVQLVKHVLEHAAK
jgi:pimeloyl-ACP methyl ester carboxylesterase